MGERTASVTKITITLAIVVESSISSYCCTKNMSTAVLVMRASASLKRMEVCSSEIDSGNSTDVEKYLTISGCCDLRVC